jgi:hypothetical protein
VWKLRSEDQKDKGGMFGIFSGSASRVGYLPFKLSPASPYRTPIHQNVEMGPSGEAFTLISTVGTTILKSTVHGRAEARDTILRY